MRRPVIATTFAVLLTILTQSSGSMAQLCAPRPGVELPPAARELMERDPRAFSFGHAWIGVAERAAAARAALADGALARGAQTAVSGNYSVPVFTVSFADTDTVPWNPADLEQRLFDAQGASLTDFYHEISGGRASVGGQVIGWTQLNEDESYYAGASNGLSPADAKIGELIAETITAHDATVDFGQFDNDGPDGIPNSGDDDGRVDFVAFVHPAFGGECGGDNPHIWSHRWRYPAWAQVPLQTNDLSPSGEPIVIDDYVMQPGLDCNGVDMIQIGVFCHEFGHAFGLPDLYDTNGGGANGVGHWCLMASGNWNRPESPAHMSAWTKAELGWVDVIDIGPEPVVTDVAPVFDSDTVYRLPFDHDRWRVRTDCAIAGDASMALGATLDESTARGWVEPKGYGNRWVETVARDFHYDGNGPVTLSYDYAVDTEGGFDFVFAIVEVDGVEAQLDVYDWTSSGTATHDLTALLGSGPVDYRVKFRFRSDTAFSNEDGAYASSCAAFAFDEVSVVGGGESYAADFEDHREGWYCPRNETDNPVDEYWLVENRRRRGFDVNLKAEGLLIYHVDDAVMKSRYGNSGGTDDAAARGIVVEEADGAYNLLALGSANRGDEGDPWPGLLSSFDGSTTPGTGSNDGMPTAISILSMNDVGDTVQVAWRAGNPAPVFAGVQPATAQADGSTITVALEGADRIAHGATVRMIRSGDPAIEATEVEWLDTDRVLATFTAEPADRGTWDVVVENPDGQNALVAAGFTWNAVATDVPADLRGPTTFALERNVPNPFNPRTLIRFAVPRTAPVQLRVYDARGRAVVTLVDEPMPAGHHEVVWDGRDTSGRTVASGVYFARMRSEDFASTQKMLMAQ